RVHAVQVGAPTPYLAMELAPGGSLADLLRRTGEDLLPVDRVRWIADGILEALEYAHLLGVVHRDVKPTNILFDDGGRVKLADFGIGTIALSTQAGPPLAQSEARTAAHATLFAGTPAYMAPEQ